MYLVDWYYVWRLQKLCCTSSACLSPTICGFFSSYYYSYSLHGYWGIESYADRLRSHCPRWPSVVLCYNNWCFSFQSSLVNHFKSSALDTLQSNIRNVDSTTTTLCPNLDSYVFAKVVQSVNGVVIEDETDESRSRLFTVLFCHSVSVHEQKNETNTLRPLGHGDTPMTMMMLSESRHIGLLTGVRRQPKS